MAAITSAGRPASRYIPRVGDAGVGVYCQQRQPAGPPAFTYSNNETQKNWPETGSRQRGSVLMTFCRNCDAVIDRSEWYPYTARRDDDGVLQTYAFCTEGCRRDYFDGPVAADD